MRTKINSSLKNLVLRLQKSNPHLGVRGLAAALRTRHNITLSKSAINTIVRRKGQSSPRGRKKSVLAYTRKSMQACGLLLFECIDSRVGLFEHVIGELAVFVPKLKPAVLQCIVRLASFAAYSGSVLENLRKTDLVKISGLYTFPTRKINYFFSQIKEYKPAVSLLKIKDNVRLVSTIKFYFENGTHGFSDARLSTLWDSPCAIVYFFSPLIAVRGRITDMIKDKIITIYYTKSFDTLSPLVTQFIEGLRSGLHKVELLDEKGQSIEKIFCESIKPHFFIGYYPKILNKGIFFLSQAPRFKRIRAITEEILYTTVSTRLVQQKTNKGVILNNVLFKRREKSLPVWGVLTDTNDAIDDCIKKYLLFFPSMDNAFIDEMKVIERFFLDEASSRNLEALIPQQSVFEKEEDFAQIINILALIFEQEVGHIALRTDTTTFRQNKDGYLFMVRSNVNELKKKFNAANLSFRGKRAYLQ